MTSRVRIARICVAVLPVLVTIGCATHRQTSQPSDYGIRPCAIGAAQRLLSIDALQCWFAAPHGRWRTLSHESHYAVLVVHVEAADVRDAAGIATQFVDTERGAYSEILLYVRREAGTDGDVTRRVRWTSEAGFESLDFSPSAR
jgi:hypothetical protein